MVYLVLTRAGFDEVRSRLQPADVVWTGRSVLSQKEIDALRGQGVDLAVFSRGSRVEVWKLCIASLQLIEQFTQLLARRAGRRPQGPALHERIQQCGISKYHTFAGSPTTDGVSSASSKID